MAAYEKKYKVIFGIWCRGFIIFVPNSLLVFYNGNESVSILGLYNPVDHMPAGITI